MSNIKSMPYYRKSSAQANINEEQKKKFMQKIESKNEVKQVKEINVEKPKEKPVEKPIEKPKSNFLGGGGGGSGFFARSTAIDIKNEPLSSYYEDRKKIIFGKINIIKDHYYISQFLLNSQKYINKEYIKMSSGSTFFMDVPQKVYNFALGLKENISNFCLVIRLNLLNDEFEKAYEIYLLMCKQNKKIIEFVYNKINQYCKKASPAMLRFTPTIAKMFINILSCLIKLSGKFCKTTYQNFFTIIYIQTIYILTVKEMHKININSYKNDLKTHRLYFYSNSLFDCSIFYFYRYQPLSFSTYILQHILELYKEKNSKEYTKYEQILMLKINYNLGLFFYVDGMNNEAINSLIQAKKILADIVFYSSKTEEKEYNSDIGGRNSAILENQEKHLLNKLTFFKEKLNNLDEKSINNLIINKYAKKNNNQNKGLKIINEESNKELPKKQSICVIKNSSSLFLGIKRIELRQPLLFEHIKRKINIEIELLLSQIELNKKNYRGSLEHINMIINKEKTKDDFEANPVIKKKTFNMINKTFKNLKSFQGIKVKTLNNLAKNENSAKVEENNKNKSNKNNNDNEETILTENDIKLIKILLEKIEHEYTENLQVQHSNSFILNKRNNYFTFSPNKTKNMNYTNFKEMEKFFIFICSLSIFQLKILNDSQPKPSSKRDDLPIIFSNQFQDCLTNAQRIELTQLETMSLTRYIILIDSDKDISPENLDYKYMKYKIKTSNDNNNDEEIFKFIVEDKGRTINSRKSNDSGMNTISTNNINSLSIKRTIKKEMEFEDENCIFDILLIKIKNEKNKNFIDSHKKTILQILNNLSNEDKKFIQKSPNLLKKMLRNIEITLKKNNALSKSFSEESSSLKSLSASYNTSQ